MNAEQEMLWSRLAARNGIETSQSNLSMCYIAIANMESGWLWNRVAASQNSPQVKQSCIDTLNCFSSVRFKSSLCV